MLDLIKNTKTSTGSFAGKMLIAMPSLSETRFSRVLVYLCIHNQEHAMGFILNRPSGLRLPALFKQLEVKCESTAPDYVVLDGGPVERDRGFVVHSNDYFSKQDSYSLDNGLALTATHNILEALSSTTPPEKSLMTLGYSGWETKQLEQEIYANDWLICDPNESLIFGENYDHKWQEALQSIGVDSKRLSSYSGEA